MRELSNSRGKGNAVRRAFMETDAGLYVLTDTDMTYPARQVHALLVSRDIFRFAVVGAVGFCVDAGVLTVLMNAGWGVIASRAVSFLLAASVTWLLNKVWTFRNVGTRAAGREYALYVGMQMIGAGINLGVFFALVLASPSLREMPVVPLAVGAGVSLGFNYFVSKRWIFIG